MAIFCILLIKIKGIIGYQSRSTIERETNSKTGIETKETHDKKPSRKEKHWKEKICKKRMAIKATDAMNKTEIKVKAKWKS